MFAEEWALMMFTLISQLAIGTFVVLTIIQALWRKALPEETSFEQTRFGILAVGPIMILALIISFFHLGTPLNAYNVLNHLGTSWLSREILFASLFVLCWLIIYYLSRNRKNNADVFYQTVSWVTVIVGMIAVYSMSSIYTATIRPAWSNINTYLSFFGTTFLLGTAGAYAMIKRGQKGKDLHPASLPALRKLSWLGLGVIAVQLLLANLAQSGSAEQTSASLFAGAYSAAFIIRWLLSISGGIMIILSLAQKNKNSTIPFANMIYLSLCLIIVGEFIGRFIFYATAVSIGMG